MMDGRSPSRCRPHHPAAPAGLHHDRLLDAVHPASPRSREPTEKENAMPKFIAVYRTIITEIWEVEAEHSEAAKSNLTENGHMICTPLYEEDVQVKRAGTFVYREGQFPSCTEIEPARAEPESGHYSSER
jgi:hypothetical protein